MCCRKKRRLCNSAIDSEEDCLTAAQIIEHRRDAVGPLLQGRKRTRLDGIGRARTWLVKEDETTQRRHRLNPPLGRWQLRKKFAAREPVRNEHDVPYTLTRGPVGDAQVPVHRIARLREHGGSLSL